MTQVSIAALVAAVRSGRQLVSFPTDTIPALAARPDQGPLIYTAKQRQPDKPLILMAATPEALWPFAQGTDEERSAWAQMAQTHWPGALTLVLPASDRVPSGLRPPDVTTIGLRVPDWAIAQTILQQTGPLSTTSINRSGQPALETLNDIEAEFPEVLTPLASQWHLPMVGDTNNPIQQPSTVIQWTGQNWEILRQGMLRL